MSEEFIRIKTLGRLARLADQIMEPVMRFGAGKDAQDEAPQETHRWNNHHLDRSLIRLLDIHPKKLVSVCGDPDACRRGAFRFHMPRFGGWRRYAVISPVPDSSLKPWYIGWISDEVFGVSRLPLYGPVRVLRGPQTTHFFGISSAGLQIRVQWFGEGEIGKGGPFSRVRLR